MKHDLEGKKVVLAYSGGLDTSVMVKWLEQNYGCEVVTFTGDLGQHLDLKSISEKAKEIGAVKAYCADLKHEFIENYVWKALKANAFYEGAYPLSTVVGRPLLAQKLVEIAEKEGAVAVAHGCTGKGNDQVRFEISVKALNPGLGIIAPIREWELTRTEEIAYAEKIGIPMEGDPWKKYSTDQNVWGRSIECGPLEDPNCEPPADVYEWTTDPEEAPDKPQYVKITFEKGVPVKLNGQEMDGFSIVESLNQIGGSHGVGRIDHIEDRLIGIKSREIYECPAAVVLIKAHEDLEKLILTKHVLNFKKNVEKEWANMAYNGLWFDPLMNALDAFIESTQQYINGDVKLKLFKGNAIVVGRKSVNSIYEYDLVTYEEHGTFDQSQSKPFINLWGLQSCLFAMKNGKKKIPLKVENETSLEN